MPFEVQSIQAMLTCERGVQVEGYFLLRTCTAKMTNAGRPYLDIVLCDLTGELAAKWWDWNGSEEYEVPSLVKVRGTLETYNHLPQLRIERIRESLPSDELDVAQYVPSAPYPADDMMLQLWEFVDKIKHPHMHEIVRLMLEPQQDAFSYFPAAVTNHHSFRSGLLYHTLTMLKAAESLLAVYPQLDADLLLAGVVLHDICKIREFDTGSLGLARGYTRTGQLLGHIVRGVAEIEIAGRNAGASDEVIELLQHMVLSHHDLPEYGSPVHPMIPEAQVLHALDNLDAKLQDMDKALSALQPGQCSDRIYSLQRRLYKAGFREE